jgi:hypothetical protein
VATAVDFVAMSSWSDDGVPSARTSLRGTAHFEAYMPHVPDGREYEDYSTGEAAIRQIGSLEKVLEWERKTLPAKVDFQSDWISDLTDDFESPSEPKRDRWKSIRNHIATNASAQIFYVSEPYSDWLSGPSLIISIKCTPQVETELARVMRMLSTRPDVHPTLVVEKVYFAETETTNSALVTWAEFLSGHPACGHYQFQALFPFAGTSEKAESAEIEDVD